MRLASGARRSAQLLSRLTGEPTAPMLTGACIAAPFPMLFLVAIVYTFSFAGILATWSVGSRLDISCINIYRREVEVCSWFVF